MRPPPSSSASCVSGVFSCWLFLCAIPLLNKVYIDHIITIIRAWCYGYAMHNINKVQHTELCIVVKQGLHESLFIT